MGERVGGLGERVDRVGGGGGGLVGWVGGLTRSVG